MGKVEIRDKINELEFQRSQRRDVLTIFLTMLIGFMAVSITIIIAVLSRNTLNIVLLKKEFYIFLVISSILFVSYLFVVASEHKLIADIQKQYELLNGQKK